MVSAAPICECDVSKPIKPRFLCCRFLREIDVCPSEKEKEDREGGFREKEKKKNSRRLNLSPASVKSSSSPTHLIDKPEIYKTSISHKAKNGPRLSNSKSMCAPLFPPSPFTSDRVKRLKFRNGAQRACSIVPPNHPKTTVAARA